MDQTFITIEQATVQQIFERKRLREALTSAQNQRSALEQLAGQASGPGSASPLPQLTSENTPPAELQMALAQLGSAIETAKQIEANIREKYAAIAEIQRKDRNLRITLIVLGVLAVLILVLVLLSVTQVI